MTIEEIKSKLIKGATHYEIDGNEVISYAKDLMGRWCYVESEWGGYPVPLSEHDRLEKELIKIEH
ncbi:hypothetical protein [Acinetobacter phage vB_AbaM_fThrA]|nr:hypothetical protein Scipio_00081 [Acinetobacter phage Scipio]WVH13615.1 hypothetical protein [Acinetobacter phage vB_AbaM_fThrA]